MARRKCNAFSLFKSCRILASDYIILALKYQTVRVKDGEDEQHRVTKQNLDSSGGRASGKKLKHPEINKI